MPYRVSTELRLQPLALVDRLNVRYHTAGPASRRPSSASYFVLGRTAIATCVKQKWQWTAIRSWHTRFDREGSPGRGAVHVQL